MNKIEFKKLSLQVVKSINDGTLDIPTIKKMVDKLKNGYSDYATRELWNETLRIATNYTVGVGDGVTHIAYSDRNPFTVIGRTANTITIQEDKAERDPTFKLNWVPGGFSAVATNNESQKWIITPDTNGKVETVHWSNRKGAWLYHKCDTVVAGRQKFYDYNF
jgi:hypothetical protein